MKIKRSDAIAAYQGLLALEKPAGGQQYNFSFEAWDTIFHMLDQLRLVNDSYARARQQRFITAANGNKAIEDIDQQIKFANEESELLDAEIRVRMPKKRLTEDQLNFAENKVPPSVRMQIKPLVEWKQVANEYFDGDEDDF